MSEVVSHIKRAKPFGIVLLFAVLTLTGVQSACARTTWKLIHQFDRSIGCGYFFDEEHGLIGSGVRWGGGGAGPACAIYKTTDGGVTWTTSADSHYDLRRGHLH